LRALARGEAPERCVPSSPETPSLRALLDELMPVDRARLERRLREIEGGAARGVGGARGARGEPADVGAAPDAIQHWRAQFERARARVEERRALVPASIVYPEDLPISQRRDEIARAIREHQVVVVCGETGSGKTTQLPKVCLELGRGVRGLIGHTQPRRIAARSVAMRISEELGTRLGDLVGFKVRFGDQTGPNNLVKLMTDGILLAETQSDRLLLQYDTLIIDEAHERSLNIDFMLGYLRQLLPKRPDLKVIVTSATIDPERFARHFARAEGGREVPAPIISVSGRTFPVEMRYRPPASDDLDERDEEFQAHIVEAVDELAAHGEGDILIFLSGEREIRETAETLERHRTDPHGPHDPRTRTQILPLFARLSAEEQQRVFQPHEGRRIVLATNVAETSLTVPGIRYVIDPGYARINRYSPRTKVQRLEIEPISRASADQRAGRCGRLGPGVCIRLYGEQDYHARGHFTDPEILRDNLASVILQMEYLQLGHVEDFPFIEPPDERAVRDGYETLHELGAIDEQQRLTPIGRDLARLPIDPRIGRMVLAGAAEGVLGDVLVIASALSIQDPRERPLAVQQQADEAHEQFDDPTSDFLGFMRLWTAWRESKRHLSSSKLRRWCKENFLSFVRMREWEDVHSQLGEMASDLKLNTGSGASRRDPKATGRPQGASAKSLGPSRQDRNGQARGAPRGPGQARSARSPSLVERDQGGRGTRGGAIAAGRSAQGGNAAASAQSPEQTRADHIHRALLTGLLCNVGVKADNPDRELGNYLGGRGNRFSIFPGSALFKQSPRWVVGAEVVRTTKVYARTVATIRPEWIEELGVHLLKRTHSEPRWDIHTGRVIANERITIFGLELVPKRRVHFGPIDPKASREIFVHHALVLGELERPPSFLEHNLGIEAQVRELEVRSRKTNLIADAEKRFRFYDARVPTEIITAGALERWRFEQAKANPNLLHMSPADLLGDGAQLPPHQAFPDTLDVGAVTLPLRYALDPAKDDDGVTAIVPLDALGQLQAEAFTWLVPGHVREKVDAILRGLGKEWRRVLPAPSQLADSVLPLMRPGQGALLDQLRQAILKATTLDVPRDALAAAPLQAWMSMRFEVVGEDDALLASGRDLNQLKAILAPKLRSGLLTSPHRFSRDGLKQWDFGDLPERVDVDRAGVRFGAFPGIVDAGASVSLRLFDTFESAQHSTRAGSRRLFMIAASEALRRHCAYVPGQEQMALQFAALGGATQLREALQELVADRAFIGDMLPVRTEKEFAFRTTRGIDNLGPAVKEVAPLVGQVLSAYHACQRELSANHPPAFGASIADMRDQLGALVERGFLTATPYAWLRHYPRFLQGIRVRYQRLQGGGVSRDQRQMEEVTPLVKGLATLRARQKELGLDAGAIDEFRWMLEELRVSLFAQELRTSVPVSVKRMHELWAQIVKA
jgi:ATP-dependent helicase HrpA